MKFTDILDDYHVPYKLPGEHHHSHEGWIQVECFQCSPDSGKFKLGYNIYKGYANCWQCGGVRAIDALVFLTKQPAAVLWRLLKSLPTQSWKSIPDRRGKLVLPAGLGPLLPPHRDYLRERGYDPDELERLWGLKGIGHAAELAWRVFIPVIHHGETVSWTCRTIGDTGKRYLNARPEQEAVSQKKVLFGADFARHVAIVVEGPFDAMKVGPGCVATMGLICTVAQQKQLGGYAKRVFCFDNEPAAQQRALSIMSSLVVFPGETLNVVLDAKDAGEASPKEIRRLRKMLG